MIDYLIYKSLEKMFIKTRIFILIHFVASFELMKYETKPLTKI